MFKIKYYDSTYSDWTGKPIVDCKSVPVPSLKRNINGKIDAIFYVIEKQTNAADLLNFFTLIMKITMNLIN